MLQSTMDALRPRNVAETAFAVLATPAYGIYKGLQAAMAKPATASSPNPVPVSSAAD